MTIIWCMVPQIWGDGVQQTELFVILNHSSPFYTSVPEIMIIILLHCCYTTTATFLLYCCYTAIMIIIMLFCSWDMACNRCNWYFLPFYSLPPPHHHPSPPPNSPKSQNWKKKKSKKMPEDIIILHMRTKNYDQMMYGS